MKYHKAHLSIWNRGGEFVCLLGFATGRVSYLPVSKYLYSLRLFLGPLKFEILWRT
jgi:hypothetical protein